MHLSLQHARTARWLAVVWAAVIGRLSMTSGALPPRAEWLWQPDKWAHAAVYGILSMLLWRGLATPQSRKGTRVGGAVTAATLYGAVMEIIQYAYFPHRYFEIWDIVANFSGACCAAWLCERIIKQ